MLDLADTCVFAQTVMSEHVQKSEVFDFMILDFGWHESFIMNIESQTAQKYAPLCQNKQHTLHRFVVPGVALFSVKMS